MKVSRKVVARKETKTEVMVDTMRTVASSLLTVFFDTSKALL